MARGYDVEAGKIQLVEQGIYNVVQGRTVAQRASYASRIAAASVMLIAAAVVCATLSAGTSGANTMVQAQLYSANGWDSIYGGASAAKSSDGWSDESGADNTGSVSQLHQQDDDVDPDSAKGDVHWNAAGDSTSDAVKSSDDTTTTTASTSQKKAPAATSSKLAASKLPVKKGKPDATDALLSLSAKFDKGLPTPKSRAEEKKQKAEQLANLLRIQKALSQDYKKVMAKGTSIKSVGKKMGLMKDKATHTAVLGGDPFSA